VAPARGRPPHGQRRLTSRAVEDEIARVSAMIADPKLRAMFEACYPNTLDTTVELGLADGRIDAFVITGDIPSLWLRDSSAQLFPYVHLVRKDETLATLFRGLIARQARSILLDPYANAFMRSPQAAQGLPWTRDDQTTRKPGWPSASGRSIRCATRCVWPIAIGRPAAIRGPSTRHGPPPRG
jgi:meiotically up-regulated gene 157 (Mug157) protein